MSDQVRFGTYNDTVTPANSSGFTGFTRQLPTDPTAPPLSYSLSFADAIKAVWRVRKCRWICKINATTGTAPNRVYSSVNYDVTSDDGFTRERDLIQAVPNVLHFSTTTPTATVNVTYENGDPPTSYTATLGINGGLAYASDTGLLYVQSIFWFGVFAFASASPTMGFVRVGSVDIFGNAFDLYADPANNVVVTTASFEAAEYWPYAAGDGSPIYNTTTGAELQSPAN